MLELEEAYAREAALVSTRPSGGALPPPPRRCEGRGRARRGPSPRPVYPVPQRGAVTHQNRPRPPAADRGASRRPKTRDEEAKKRPSQQGSSGPRSSAQLRAAVVKQHAVHRGRAEKTHPPPAAAAAKRRRGPLKTVS